MAWQRIDSRYLHHPDAFHRARWYRDPNGGGDLLLWVDQADRVTGFHLTQARRIKQQVVELAAVWQEGAALSLGLVDSGEREGGRAKRSPVIRRLPALDPELVRGMLAYLEQEAAAGPVEPQYAQAVAAVLRGALRQSG